MIRHSLRLSSRLQQRRLLLLGARDASPKQSRSLHEGRTVLDVGLGENDHVLQVYGANTEVGKTVITAGLLRAAVPHGLLSSYIKPIQAGSPSDASFVSKHAGDAVARSSTLFNYTDPVSPHLAAARDRAVISDDAVVVAVVEEIKAALTDGVAAERGDHKGHLVLVEAAGGVLSPAPSGSLQADAFRPMRLPVLLVGDGRLGGIGATLSALESLRTRGYSVFAVVLIEQGKDLGNAEAISRHVGHIPVFDFPALPPLDQPLDPWYTATERRFSRLFRCLVSRHAEERTKVLGMKERGRKALWWPFTQHDDVSEGEINVLDSSYGDYFCALEVEGPEPERKGEKPRVSQRALVDACASWWTHGAGHGNPRMALAIAEAAGRYGHVIFPGNVHAPALEVAERLLAGPGDGWASRVFFTDNGSTATEVAIKMGFRRFLKDRFSSAEPPAGTGLSVVAQEGCYHGDTLGAMDVAVPSVFNRGQHAWYQARGLFFETPRVSWRGGRFTVELPQSMKTSGAVVSAGPEMALASRDAAFDFGSRDASELAALYREHVRSKMDEFEAEDGRILGSLLLEPVLMGAGGMIFVDPLFQRVLVQECRARRLPVIYDEVFCGLWRLGSESARELLGEDPDVSCYAKLLTGGLVPMSATVATERVFEAFSGEKADCLLHGHSYTAHPVGCAAAVEFLDQLDNSDLIPSDGGRMADSWDETAVRELSTLPAVDRAFALGSVLAVEMKANDRGYNSQAALEVVEGLSEEGMYARVLGNVAYVMVSPLTRPEVCGHFMSIVERVLRRQGSQDSASDPAAVGYHI